MPQSGAWRTMCGIIGVYGIPQATAIVTMLGSATTQYPQNLIWQKDAIAFATADLVRPSGNVEYSQQTHNGIRMRVVKQYDIINDQDICRVDILYGYTALRPQCGVRLWG